MAYGRCDNARKISMEDPDRSGAGPFRQRTGDTDGSRRCSHRGQRHDSDGGHQLGVEWCCRVAAEKRRSPLCHEDPPQAGGTENANDGERHCGGQARFSHQQRSRERDLLGGDDGEQNPQRQGDHDERRPYEEYDPITGGTTLCCWWRRQRGR